MPRVLRPARCLLTALVLACAMSSVGPLVVEAQDRGFHTWTGEVGFASANAVIGGLTAGLMQEIRGGSFRDGFTRGAMGATLAYTGRRVAAERFQGAGLLGRQVSGVGASVVRNAAEGRPSFQTLLFPIGPLNVYLDRSGPSVRIRPKVNAASFGHTIAAIVSDDFDFDLSESVSSGAPVFRAPGRRVLGDGGDDTNGATQQGVIYLSGLPGPDSNRTLPHERVHVLQNDFTFQVWSDPFEAWAVSQFGLGRKIYQFLDFNIAFSAVWSGLDRRLERDHNPFEVEADFLERR